MANPHFDIETTNETTLKIADENWEMVDRWTNPLHWTKEATSIRELSWRCSWEHTKSIIILDPKKLSARER